MHKFDLIVLGSGPGGSSVASASVKDGKSVAVIDGLFGGTCALRGCTPKRAMEAVTSTYWEAKDAETNGFPLHTPPVDWKALMHHKSKFTASVPGNTKADFAEEGIDVIQGYGAFVDAHTIEVNGKEYKADKIVIATGAKPRPLTFPGAEYLITNADFFELDRLPRRIAIVGGGYIGFELSHIIAACGSEVTILSDADLPLSAFDNNFVNTLVQATLHKGIEVKLGFSVRQVKKYQEHFIVEAERNGNQTFSMEADLVIHAAGRVPAIERLHLDRANIITNDEGGVAVDEFLCVPDHDHIYALGDVTGNLPFTETANYEAKIVHHNLYADRRKKVDYTGMPMVVYTYPKMAMVGRKEADDPERFYTREASLKNSFIQRCKANRFARYKTIINKSTKQVVGAHMLGYNADEAINVFAMAIQLGVTCEQMKNLFLAYPTAIHDVKYLI